MFIGAMVLAFYTYWKLALAILTLLPVIAILGAVNVRVRCSLFYAVCDACICSKSGACYVIIVTVMVDCEKCIILLNRLPKCSIFEKREHI